ncbi:MAG: carbohydrate-binding family 9-like protein [Myxococcales bacterium]|nr:MAG: carbohydrate-binding family 9-like protein [Myxococcales bacterium]
MKRLFFLLQLIALLLACSSKKADNKKTPEPKTISLIPRISVPYTSSPPVIDGKIDTKEWFQAKETSFRAPLDGGPPSFPARAFWFWDTSYLYLAFVVTDSKILSPHTTHDARLWEHDAIELQIDPSGTGKNYFEIQVAPNGHVFDTKFLSPRNPQPFGLRNWDSNVVASAVMHGKANDDVKDTGYTVELALPWQSILEKAPITKDDIKNMPWRANIYVMNRLNPKQQTAVAWSALHIGDFHTPARYGFVKFVDK